jgi:hypothetical protein
LRLRAVRRAGPEPWRVRCIFWNCSMSGVEMRMESGGAGRSKLVFAKKLRIFAGMGCCRGV